MLDGSNSRHSGRDTSLHSGRAARHGSREPVSPLTERHCFVVVEESLRDGTIAEYRRSRPRQTRPLKRLARLGR